MMKFRVLFIFLKFELVCFCFYCIHFFNLIILKIIAEKNKDIKNITDRYILNINKQRVKNNIFVYLFLAVNLVKNSLIKIYKMIEFHIYFFTFNMLKIGLSF